VYRQFALAVRRSSSGRTFASACVSVNFELAPTGESDCLIKIKYCDGRGLVTVDAKCDFCTVHSALNVNVNKFKKRVAEIRKESDAFVPRAADGVHLAVISPGDSVMSSFPCQKLSTSGPLSVQVWYSVEFEGHV